MLGGIWQRLESSSAPVLCGLTALFLVLPARRAGVLARSGQRPHLTHGGLGAIIFGMGSWR